MYQCVLYAAMRALTELVDTQVPMAQEMEVHGEAGREVRGKDGTGPPKARAKARAKMGEAPHSGG